MKNLRVVNLVLLVFWAIHSAIITSIVVLGFIDVFSRKGQWAIVEQITVALVSIPIIILMVKAINLIRSYTKYDYINNNFNKNLLNKYKFYLYLIMGISFLMASDNGSLFYPGFINIILLCIIPVIVVLSIYKIRIETQLLNNKQNQNSDVLNSENNNLYVDSQVQKTKEEKSTEDDFIQKIKNYYK
jgi:hypothetical protein